MVAAAGLWAAALGVGVPERAVAGEVGISIRTPSVRISIGDRERSFERRSSRFHRSRSFRRFGREPRRSIVVTRSRGTTVVIGNALVIVQSGDDFRKVERRRGFRERRFHHRIRSRSFDRREVREVRRAREVRKAREVLRGRYRGSTSRFVYRDGRRVRD